MCSSKYLPICLLMLLHLVYCTRQLASLFRVAAAFFPLIQTENFFPSRIGSSRTSKRDWKTSFGEGKIRIHFHFPAFQ